MKKKIVFLCLFLCVAGIVFARTYKSTVQDVAMYNYSSWDDFYYWIEKAKKNHKYAAIYMQPTGFYYTEDRLDSGASLYYTYELFTFYSGYRSLNISFFDDDYVIDNLKYNPDVYELKIFKCTDEKKIKNYWNQLLDKM